MRSHVCSRRALGAEALTVGLLLAGASSASAHVTIHSDTTAPGGWAQLTFRVPTESATASTNKLVITLPQDTPLAYVSTKPVNGWTATVREDPLPTPVQLESGATLTKAAHIVTWQAGPGHAIKPGQYQEFSISAGPLPEQGTLLFPAEQYYSDGSVVHWDQPRATGAEPEHPAPALTIAATEAAGPHGPQEPAAQEPGRADPPSGDPAARWLAGGALLLGAGALGVSVAGRRARRDSTPARGADV